MPLIFSRCVPKLKYFEYFCKKLDKKAAKNVSLIRYIMSKHCSLELLDVSVEVHLLFALS